jgi:hypothetical protein
MGSGENGSKFLFPSTGSGNKNELIKPQILPELVEGSIVKQ